MKIFAIVSIVQYKFHDQQVLHPPLARNDLHPAQHLRPQAQQGGRILEIGGFDGPQIAVQHIDNARFDRLDLGAVDRHHLKLGRKLEVSIGPAAWQ